MRIIVILLLMMIPTGLIWFVLGSVALYLTFGDYFWYIVPPFFLFIVAFVVNEYNREDKMKKLKLQKELLRRNIITEAELADRGYMLLDDGRVIKKATFEKNGFRVRKQDNIYVFVGITVLVMILAPLICSHERVFDNYWVIEENKVCFVIAGELITFLLARVVWTFRNPVEAL